ncbi:MAG: hypothetical protein NZ902_04380 [Acidilobaceae archaeon]|nr:hypothetical protein [Acidilobaceae archaeon]MDW7974449.1 hypothetical protein [Sulfolobales archaeon]
MRLFYDRAERFKHLTHALSRLNDEVFMEVNKDGARFWLMSPDKTSMAYIYLPYHSFSEFEVPVETAFSLSTDELDKVMRRAARNDQLLVEDREDALDFVLVSKREGIERRFSLPASRREERFRDLKIRPTVEFTMTSEDFKVLLSDVKLVSDSVTFRAEEGQVIATARGEEKSYEWVLKENDPLLSLSVREPAEASYSTSALEVAMRPILASQEIRISYATEHPMKMSFAVEGEEIMVIYIAPLAE